MKDIVIDSCILKARDKISCIKLVAKYLRSENQELHKEAIRIRSNLEENVKRQEEERAYSHEKFPILNKDFSPINFKNYIERLKDEKYLNSIVQELEGPFYLAYKFRA